MNLLFDKSTSVLNVNATLYLCTQSVVTNRSCSLVIYSILDLFFFSCHFSSSFFLSFTWLSSILCDSFFLSLSPFRGQIYVFCANVSIFYSVYTMYDCKSYSYLIYMLQRLGSMHFSLKHHQIQHRVGSIGLCPGEKAINYDDMMISVYFYPNPLSGLFERLTMPTAGCIIVLIRIIMDNTYLTLGIERYVWFSSNGWFKMRTTRDPIFLRPPKASKDLSICWNMYDNICLLMRFPFSIFVCHSIWHQSVLVAIWKETARYGCTRTQLEWAKKKKKGREATQKIQPKQIMDEIDI